MKNLKLAMVSALGLMMGAAGCGGPGEQVVELDPSVSEAVCVSDAECAEGFVCQEGSCAEVIVPENPEAPQPEPEPEEDVKALCETNADCENGQCSAETGYCVAQCPMGTYWKTPVGETTGECKGFMIVAPLPPPSCLSDVDCQDGFVCENGQCMPEPDPVPGEAWM